MKDQHIRYICTFTKITEKTKFQSLIRTKNICIHDQVYNIIFKQCHRKILVFQQVKMSHSTGWTNSINMSL